MSEGVSSIKIKQLLSFSGVEILVKKQKEDAMEGRGGGATWIEEWVLLEEDRVCKELRKPFELPWGQMNGIWDGGWR